MARSSAPSDPSQWMARRLPDPTWRAAWRKWTNSHPDLWKSSPIKGDIGLVFVPEAEIFNYMQQGDTAFYAQSIRGAYQAFFDSNIQPDFVSLDDIGEYKIIYLPYPVMLTSETVAKLRKFVEQGGTLVSEGLPGYFGDHGHVGTVQPNYGLDEVFGARESHVEFMPDISDQLKFQLKGADLFGRYFRQEYKLQRRYRGRQVLRTEQSPL